MKTNLTRSAYLGVLCFFWAQQIQAQITINDYSRVDRLYAYAESPHDNVRNDAFEEDLTQRQYERAYGLPTAVAGARADLTARHMTSIVTDNSSLFVSIEFSIGASAEVDDIASGSYFAETKADISFHLEFTIDEPMDFLFSPDTLGFDSDLTRIKELSFYERSRGPSRQLRGSGLLDPGEYVLDISVTSEITAGFLEAGETVSAHLTGRLQVVPIAPVPEPTTYAALFATGCLAYGIRRRLAKPPR